MSKRFDNRKLIYILASLIVMLAFTVLIKIPKERATLKDKIVDFDITEVSGIVIYPQRSDKQAVEFNKAGNRWNVQQGNIISPARQYEVDNILTEILSVRPQNLVSKSKLKWNEFHVTDSSGTRIEIVDKKGKTLADIVVGRFSYKQVSSQMSMYGSNNIQGTSYVRLTGEDEVYGVEGFLSLSFNRTFNDWRDNTLVEFSKDDITSIRYIYPADSSFILSKRDSKWFLDNMPADSANVESFLTSLSNIDGQEFNDTYKPDVNPDYQLIIEGNNLLNISVKGYKGADGEIIINSSLNPGIYFNSSPEGVSARIFKSKRDFIEILSFISFPSF
jgi:hypothetical protein